MMEEKKLQEKALDKVVGGHDEGTTTHTCDNCDGEMVFDHFQDYALPAVYVCKRCGNKMAFAR